MHIAIKLFEDPEGIARQAVLRNSNEETLRSILRVLKKKLVRLPSVDPPPDQVSQQHFILLLFIQGATNCSAYSNVLVKE